MKIKKQFVLSIYEDGGIRVTERALTPRNDRGQFAGTGREFVDQWETQLRDGVRIGNLRLKLKGSRQFVAELA